MKIINVSNEPYFWTFDSGNYGPVLPGQIWEGIEEIARHALKRSAIVDEFGEVASFRMEEVGAMSKERIREFAAYPCPFTQSNQCNTKPFRSIDDLRRHMESHWGSEPEQTILTGLESSTTAKTPVRK